MNTREAESLVYKYIAKHDLPDEWLFRWQNKKGALGTCSYNKKDIRLSKWYVELNDIEDVKDTILHEIAHGLTYVRHGKLGMGHGVLWKKVCREIGAIPKSCSKDNLNKPKDHYKYNHTCKCGIHYGMHRLRKHYKYRCPKCKDPLFISKKERIEHESAVETLNMILASWKRILKTF